MEEWKSYVRKYIEAVILARPYIPGEPLPYVSMSSKPEEGGMIARNPDNEAHQWYIDSEFFNQHYEEVQ